MHPLIVKVRVDCLYVYDKIGFNMLLSESGREPEYSLMGVLSSWDNVDGTDCFK